MMRTTHLISSQLLYPGLELQSHRAAKPQGSGIVSYGHYGPGTPHHGMSPEDNTQETSRYTTIFDDHIALVSVQRVAPKIEHHSLLSTAETRVHHWTTPQRPDWPGAVYSEL